jgi:hypothetical protein
MSFHALSVFWLGIVPVIRYGCVTLGLLTVLATCWAIRDYRRLTQWMEELRTAWSEQTGFTAGSSPGQEPANLDAARRKGCALREGTSVTCTEADPVIRLHATRVEAAVAFRHGI